MTPKRFDVRELLDPAEVGQVEAFNDNPILKQAVRKIILFPLYHSGTLKQGQAANPMLNWIAGFLSADPKATNEEVGLEVKVRYAAIELLEGAFNELEKVRRVAEDKPNEISAR